MRIHALHARPARGRRRCPPSSASPAAPATSALPVGGRESRLVDGVACAVFVGCALLLFRLSLFQGWTFIGDPDRLNNIMNLRLFEVVSLLKRGAVPAWSEYEFMGYGVSGVHWMLPGAPPLAQILALLPLSELYHALALLAATLFAATMMAAYWGLGPYSSGPVQRVVGALLYATGAYVVHKLMQLDLSFAALMAPPILLRLTYGTRRDRAHWTFLGMAACWAFLVVFTVLQEIAYIGLSWGLYALYRSIRLRTPWPVLAAGLAFVVGCVIGAPRVITVAGELSVVARTSSNIQTTAIEAVRYFGDGLLGRSQGEQAVLRGAAINLHEGVQLLGSSLAASAVIAYGLVTPSRWLRFWSVALLVILSVALNAYFRTFYDLDALGLRGMTYPSRELRTVAVNAVLIGLPAWLLGWRLTKAVGLHSAASSSTGTGDAIAEDLPFFFGFVVLALAVILIPEARIGLYYAFLKIDFQHSRISVATILPLAAIAVVFLNRFLPGRVTSRTARWLGSGLVLGLVLWLVREFAAEAIVGQVGPALDTLRPRRLLTVEVVRVLASLLVVLAACTMLVRGARPSWLVVAGGVMACWMVLETVGLMEWRLNGPSATEQTRPFSNLDYMQVPPGQMRVPSLEQRAALGSRLESDRYRTVVIEDRDTFLSYADSHLAAFWDLRLVEGYSTGSPRRFGALPWSDDIYAAHQTGISSGHPIQRLPWKLLAALNVKYVVTVDRSLWFNPAPGGPVPPLDIARLDVHENPNPVTPRAFFTARVVAAGQQPRLIGDDGKRPPPDDPPIEPPARQSVVEGFPGGRQFSTDGTLDATFDGDRVSIRVDASREDRFLILNEMYHPTWRATVDGAPATIYPTNLVMRGILVPAGATAIELTYRPFVFSATGYAVMALGVVLGGLLTWGLRSVDLIPKPPFLTWRGRR
jgi:hypothetical protein